MEEFKGEEEFVNKLWDLRKSSKQSESLGLYPIDKEVLDFMERAYNIHIASTGLFIGTRREIVTFELLFMVGGLALLDTLSPAALGVTIYLLLTEKEQLSSRLMIYLLTVAVIYFSVGVAFMLGLDAFLVRFSSIFQNRIVSWAMLIIGGILFIASFYYPKSKKTNLPGPKSNSKKSMITLGFMTSLIEVGAAFPYFATIGLMNTSNLSVFSGSQLW